MPTAGQATLTYRTPVSRWLWLGGQLVLWLLVLGYLLRTRVRALAAQDLVVVEAEGELA